MRATKFEYKHQVLLHLLLVGLASLSYLYDRVDVVWGAVQHHSNSATLERLIFGFGAFMLIASAMVETWASAQSQRDHYQVELRLARVLLVLAVGLWLPLPGAIILLTGETILITRLSLRNNNSDAHSLLTWTPTHTNWLSGFRVAASKWGLTISMIAFVWTLQDKIAEIGAGCSVVLWLVLNLPVWNRQPPL